MDIDSIQNVILEKRSSSSDPILKMLDEIGKMTIDRVGFDVYKNYVLQEYKNNHCNMFWRNHASEALIQSLNSLKTLRNIKAIETYEYKERI